MGTNSLTFIHEEKDNDIICCIYKKYDSYPSCYGLRLANFLLSRKLLEDDCCKPEKNTFYGMCCLAAQIVQHLKDGAGGIFLIPPFAFQYRCQCYEYHIYNESVKVLNGDSYGLQVYDSEKRDKRTNVIFEGTWNDFKAFCLESEREDE